MNAKLKKAKEIKIDHIVCKGCHICIDQCPQKVLEVSSNRSINGYFIPLVANLDICSVCKICEMICPDLAITVEGEKDEK
jgi:2-oxoglutarate ferredoxin oxidoreductase subunit delta